MSLLKLFHIFIKRENNNVKLLFFLIKFHIFYWKVKNIMLYYKLGSDIMENKIKKKQGLDKDFETI